MSYLMGFVPGDQGWIGGGGDDDDGDKDDDDDKADGIDGGINADKKGAGINGSSTKDRGYGLDPKALTGWTKSTDYPTDERLSGSSTSFLGQNRS